MRGYIQYAIYIPHSEKDLLDEITKLSGDKSFRSVSETTRFLLRKGIEAYKKEKQALSSVK